MGQSESSAITWNSVEITDIYYSLLHDRWNRIGQSFASKFSLFEADEISVQMDKNHQFDSLQGSRIQMVPQQ
jgi:hypothetical protein